ncbi:hypothetical protein V6478_000755 [Providencia rettgeri]|uniref:hypothetical protein n=1 Tax=Providencia rettgeri TaxID=587 RepID=UPI0018C7B148|nr:hypothetical protein [Providencia rettgeri]EHZ7765327.1 hypothetical protein [Providencia rettgeri]EIJ7168469.1 hypothetical protein [Providencia rettgeri]EJD6046815.1 hypothetical protein [Providencia rettgeri]EJD6474952.1 hypothetical protein [Providencia rettgeri]ELR5066586.1 hypothetical protein [Providencia rettgeri]
MTRVAERSQQRDKVKYDEQTCSKLFALSLGDSRGYLGEHTKVCDPSSRTQSTTRQGEV